MNKQNYLVDTLRKLETEALAAVEAASDEAGLERLRIS